MVSVIVSEPQVSMGFFLLPVDLAEGFSSKILYPLFPRGQNPLFYRLHSCKDWCPILPDLNYGGYERRVLRIVLLG